MKSSSASTPVDAAVPVASAPPADSLLPTARPDREHRVAVTVYLAVEEDARVIRHEADVISVVVAPIGQWRD